MEIFVKGVVTNIGESLDIETWKKNCSIFLSVCKNPEEEIEKCKYNTHFGILKCGNCGKEPFITGFNLESKMIKCHLCKAINEI